jgi:hypothetical protein
MTENLQLSIVIHCESIFVWASSTNTLGGGPPVCASAVPPFWTLRQQITEVIRPKICSTSGCRRKLLVSG